MGIAGIISIINGLLAAVRAALQVDTTAEKHRMAASRWSKLWVRFDDYEKNLKLSYCLADNELNQQKRQEWSEWFKDYLDVMEECPVISDSDYQKYKDLGGEDDNACARSCWGGCYSWLIWFCPCFACCRCGRRDSRVRPRASDEESQQCSSG